MKARSNIVLVCVFTLMLCFSHEATAHPASGIVVDTKGNVYFSDLETVWKINSSGDVTLFRRGVSGRHVHELAIDENDNILGADISYESEKWISAVWKLSPSGEITYLLQPTANPPRGMSLWMDRQGNMYLVDQNNHTKTQTLLLRRTADGNVITLAGSSYGHADGKGTEARFGSVGGMTLGPDGNVYLTDGDSVRRVTMDGTVTTVARGLSESTSADTPTLFGRNHTSLAGLAVAKDGTAFVADSGNRRLLKIQNGKMEVVLRSEPPFFPTGAAVTPSGDVYILEVGLTLPNISRGPRVRKLTADGEVVVLTTLGEERGQRSIGAFATEKAGIAAESIVQSFFDGGATKYFLIATVPAIIGLMFIWRRRKRIRKV